MDEPRHSQAATAAAADDDVKRAAPAPAAAEIRVAIVTGANTGYVWDPCNGILEKRSAC